MIVRKEKKQVKHVESIYPDSKETYAGCMWYLEAPRAGDMLHIFHHFKPKAEEQKEQDIPKLYPLFSTAHIQPSQQSFGEVQQIHLLEENRC